MPNLILITVIGIWCFVLSAEIKELKAHQELLSKAILNVGYEADVLTQYVKGNKWYLEYAPYVGKLGMTTTKNAETRYKLYSIIIIRSGLIRFSWELKSNNRTISKSKIYYKKEHCERIVKKLNIKLNGKIRYRDMNDELL